MTNISQELDANSSAASKRKPDHGSVASGGHSDSLISSASLALLEQQGYCVIRGFLDTAESKEVYADYLRHGASGNLNYSIGLASENTIRFLKARITQLAGVVSERTSIKTNYEGLHQAYYFDSQTLNFNAWHQDAESYYMLQDHKDYLNFYIPVRKPDRSRTNLQVIPWDRLADRLSENIVNLLRGYGGTICVKTAEAGTQILSEDGLVAHLDFDINELAETPELGAGDLLLLRGDTFHRTQDVDTARVAISLRLFGAEKMINYRELCRGSTRKFNLMANNWQAFGPLFHFFGVSGVREISWNKARDLIQQEAKEGAWAETTVSSAKLQILKHKLLTGCLFDTVRKELSYRMALRQIDNASR